MIYIFVPMETKSKFLHKNKNLSKGNVWPIHITSNDRTIFLKSNKLSELKLFRYFMLKPA